ncbi:SemiSWEET family sugar transporter [uncultured Phenylobacterium sp.]|uniref:SemiSWEET family sugar transporter n=1 Tax=uncultured Phenylobacterium sp. TaxID=349273 RepID=UPI0025D044B4|nr:SemiSWEET transporter [uncultured Phenylobacterium sp.]
MNFSTADLIGTGAALCSMTSFVPQIVKIVRERDATSVSLRMYAVTVTGFGLWIAYGVMTRAWPVMGANTVCLLLSATILVLKWRFQTGQAGKAG